MIGQTPGPLKSWKMKISRIFLFLSGKYASSLITCFTYPLKVLALLYEINNAMFALGHAEIQTKYFHSALP